MKKLLVIAAHPDDEVLGCGATVALRVEQGVEAHLLIMATGITSREISPEEAKKQIEQLREETKKAARIIGFKSYEHLEFPDNRLDTVSRMDLSQAIKKRVSAIQPDTIFTHHPGDYNWDHTQVFDAVMMAARSSPGEFAPSEIFSFEVLSSTERSWQDASRVFLPNTYVNISKSLHQKKEAMKAYSLELKDFPHPRSLSGIEVLARKRGMEVGMEAAEAFHLIRRVES